MSTKTIGIMIGGFAGGVIVISIAMMAGASWETPGMYTGTSNAAHTTTDSTHCYAFQTGCKNIQTTIPPSQMDSGAYLSGDYGH